MATTRPLVHLFVGLHKTGSTAIRFMLDVHRELLDRHGFHLPVAAWTQYIDGFWNGGHNNLPWEITGNRPTVAPYGGVAELVAEIASMPERQHLVVSEDLDTLRADGVARLAEAFAGFDVHVIVFVRNQVDWLRSLIAEEQKWFGAWSFADGCRAHIETDHRFDYHAMCAPWSATFSRITIRTYESIRSRVFEAFLDCCAAPAGLREALALRSVALVNTSPDPTHLELLRRASNFAASQGVSPRWFNATVSAAVLTAARELKPGDRRRFPIPDEFVGPLTALMRRSNQALADTYGVALGPEYLDPVVNDPPTGEPSLLGGDEIGRWLLAACLDVSVRAGTRVRLLEARLDPAADANVGRRTQRLVQRFHPWTAADHDSPLLDELILAALNDGTGLYVERKGESCVAYRQSQGDLVALRQLNDAEWRDLATALRLRAGLHVVSWNNILEGLLTVRAPGAAIDLWVRQAPTPDGDVLVIERVKPAQLSAGLY
jgi:hypothetical protein